MDREDLPDERLERELERLLEELRIALPGVQILFAFLFAVPFASRFEDVTPFQTKAYFVSFLTALAASVFLIAPTSYHRIRFRRHDDPERMVRNANVFAIVGLAFSPSPSPRPSSSSPTSSSRGRPRSLSAASRGSCS